MTTAEIIAEASQIGLTLRIRSGKLVVSGLGTRPAHLMESIRSRKAEILSLLLQRPAQNGERGDESEERTAQRTNLPPNDLPMPAVAPWTSEAEVIAMINHVINQGSLAIRWCSLRANQYYRQFPRLSFKEQDVAAALDLLSWQEQLSS